MLAVSILSAELRSASEARQKLTTALTAPEPVRAFDLAVLVVAEERHEEDVGEIRESIDQSIAGLAERSSTRVRLAELVGSAADEHAVAAAVGATLFGSGAPDDDGSAFFAGSSEKASSAELSFVACSPCAAAPSRCMPPVLRLTPF